MQYLTNFHSHCVFCDGRASMDAFVQYAIAKGFKAYGISSHAPVPFITRWAMHQEDLADYLQEFYRLKDLYASQIELYLGLELDFLAKEKDAVFETHKDLALDYRIGSIHYIDTMPDGSHWNIDCETGHFMRAVQTMFGGDIKLACKAFYLQTCQMIESCQFEILGHMDKISRNAANYPEFNVDAQWYQNMIYDTLALVKEKGIVVEINTKALNSKGLTYPNIELFAMLKGMQIPVMVNSDAHYPDMVAAGLQDTYEALTAVGIQSVRILKNGIWVDEEIK